MTLGFFLLMLNVMEKVSWHEDRLKAETRKKEEIHFSPQKAIHQDPRKTGESFKIFTESLPWLRLKLQDFRLAWIPFARSLCYV